MSQQHSVGNKERKERGRKAKERVKKRQEVVWG